LTEGLLSILLSTVLMVAFETADVLRVGKPPLDRK
jgi:hypothetical protein